jgi:hypothetical protein
MTKTHDEAMAVALDARPDGPVRDNAAWRRYFEHEERMARALAPREPSYEISQKSPAGKTPGFEFTITHPDPEEAAKLAHKWHKEFPAPQPVVKP